MIPRLDVAVHRRRRARPVWRAALCGQHTALEPVTERLQDIYRYWRRGTNFAPRETLPDKLLAHIASLGWEHIGFSSGYVCRPNRSNRRFRPCESCAPRSSCRLAYDLEQILR